MDSEIISFLCQYCGLMWRIDRTKYKIRDLKTDKHHWREYSSMCPVCERNATTLVQRPESHLKLSTTRGNR